MKVPSVPADVNDRTLGCVDRLQRLPVGTVLHHPVDSFHSLKGAVSSSSEEEYSFHTVKSKTIIKWPLRETVSSGLCC